MASRTVSFPCLDGVYEESYIDGSLVAHLAGSSLEPFWPATYTTLIRWLRVAACLTDSPEVTVARAGALVADPELLARFVDRGVGVATASGQPFLAADLRRGIDDSLVGFDSKLRRLVIDGLSAASHSTMRLCLRPGHQERLGLPPETVDALFVDRTGSWACYLSCELPPVLRALVS